MRVLKNTIVIVAAAGAYFMLTQLSIAAEEVAFGKQELQEYLVGKTYPLSKGAFYFDDSETLSAIWKGQTETAKWWTTDDSQFCYNLKMFGAEECLGLFKKGDDELIQIYEGKRRTINLSDIKEGKAF